MQQKAIVRFVMDSDHGSFTLASPDMNVLAQDSALYLVSTSSMGVSATVKIEFSSIEPEAGYVCAALTLNGEDQTKSPVEDQQYSVTIKDDAVFGVTFSQPTRWDQYAAEAEEGTDYRWTGKYDTLEIYTPLGMAFLTNEMALSSDGFEGVTVKLMNDIDLGEKNTSTDTVEWYPIGGSDNKHIFAGVFDGQGHTLSHIRLTKKLNGYTNYGIFGETDTTGIIRNLTVEDVSFTQNGNIGYVGLLVGVNRGKIYNCTVKDCTMKAASKSEVDYSGITCSNQGSIINCHADNINITTDKTVNSMAGIAKYNRGNILNCYVTHMKFSGSTGGAHVCYENRDNIQNCYVYGTEGKYNALCYSAINDSYIAYCYYPDTYKKKPVELEQKPNHEMLLKYDKNCLIKDSNEALHEKMNQWIDEIGKTKYPDFKFTKWTEGENVPATFVTQP